MKQAFIFPGLLATAMAAALPAGDLVPEFTDAPFDLAQVTVEAPRLEVVSPDVLAAAVDPELFLGSADADDTSSLNVDGEAAWLKIQAEIAAGLDLDLGEAPAHPMKWSGLHLAATATVSDSNSDAEGLAPPRPAWPLTKPSWWPGNTQPIPDFHNGVTADGVCEYLRGAAWKVNELRRPAEQLAPEYVPWLPFNKGPYYYVLEGLREIEWVFLRLFGLLEYTSRFTEEEQRQIIRCYLQFAGVTRLLTTLPTALPTGPGPVLTNPISARQEIGIQTESSLPLATETQLMPDPLATETPLMPDPLPTTTASATAGGPEPTRRVVVVRPRPDDELPPLTVPFPWGNRFSFKDLLRIIYQSSPSVRGQLHAYVRIERVLRNLDTSVKLFHSQLLKALTLEDAREIILNERSLPGGLEDAVETALDSYSIDG